MSTLLPESSSGEVWMIEESFESGHGRVGFTNSQYGWFASESEAWAKCVQLHTADPYGSSTYDPERVERGL